MKILKLYKRTYTIYLIIAIFLAVAGYLSDTSSQQKQWKGTVKRFNKQLFLKEKKLRQRTDDIVNLLSGEPTTNNYFDLLSKHNDILTDEGTGFLIYSNDSLKYWSDNEISYLQRGHRSSRTDGLIRLPNGWFLKQTTQLHPYTIYGFIQLKDEFQHQNKYLKNEFRKEYRMDGQFDILRPDIEEEKSFPLFNTKGEKLFSLRLLENHAHRAHLLHPPCLFYVLTFFVLLAFLYVLVRRQKKLPLLATTLLLLVGIAGIYGLLVWARMPSSLFEHDLFSPKYFAYTQWFPSLGHFLLLAVLLFFWSLTTYKLPAPSAARKRRAGYLLFGISSIQLLVITKLQAILFRNTSVSFEFYNIIDLSTYSILGIIAILMLFGGYFLLSFRAVSLLAVRSSKRRVYLLLFTTSLAVGIIALLWNINQAALWMLFHFVFNLITLFTGEQRYQKYRLSFIVGYTLVSSVVFLGFMQENLENKEREVQQFMAINLASEHDPVAEIFLKNIDQRIKQDSVLMNLFDDFDTPVEPYLLQNYFGGYWRQYEVQFTICTATDSVEVQPDNELLPCYPFFEALIDEQGLKIAETDFFFMDQMNGRVAYFGRLHYSTPGFPGGITLFIEMNSRIQPEGIGFPELLLDEKATRSSGNLKKYAFAKYHDNQLLTRHGEFIYDLSALNYNKLIKESNHFTCNGFEHFAYQYGDNNLIIVSKKSCYLTST